MLSVKEIRAHRPGEVVTARSLSIIAAVLWAPLAAFVLGPVSFWLLLFYVSASFGAAKGRQAARVAVTTALVPIYLFLLPGFLLGFLNTSPISIAYTVMDIVAVLVSAIALGLLYRPRSNIYFHLITVARQTR